MDNSILKHAFAERLNSLMAANGWHQSELARQANLPRDSISVYLRGKSIPTAKNIEALCHALKVSKAELLPEKADQNYSKSPPLGELKILPNDPKRARLIIDRVLSTDRALKVFEIINQEDVV